MDEWIDVYRHISIPEMADWICKKHLWSGSRNFVEIMKIHGGITPLSRIMDAGCATGKIGLAAVLRVGCRLTCLDCSMDGIRLAEKVYQELLSRTPKKLPSVSFVRGDIQNLPYTNHFDMVFNEGVVEHWQDRKKRLNAIIQMVKSTRPGGKVLIWVPNQRNPFYWLYKKMGYNRPAVKEWLFNPEELKELMAEAGLREVRVMGFQPYLSPFFLSPPYIRRLKILAILLWLAGMMMPSGIREVLSLKFSFEIFGAGTKIKGEDAKTNV